MQSPSLRTILSQALYARLAGEYRERWNAYLKAVDCAGSIVYGSIPCEVCRPGDCQEARVRAVQSTMRWGEVSVSFCPCERLIWAVPITLNEEVVGGLVASLPEQHAFDGEGDQPRRDFRELCQALRLIAERENLTNASHLELRRLQYSGEQQKAYAIHAYKNGDHNSLRRLYLAEEPALFSAIRSGDRNAARQIINRILVALHHHAGTRTDLLKSVFLELVVVMCRTAVEAGGNPEELLGSNFNSMAALSALDTEAEIGIWLVHTLEHLMDAIERTRPSDPGVIAAGAIAFMEQNCHRQIQRDAVAAAVGVSPSHFSFLVRRETGMTFTELLNQMRVDRAAELLLKPKLPLASIASKCGFSDQSYFTKVFRRYRGQTPLKYRKREFSR